MSHLSHPPFLLSSETSSTMTPTRAWKEGKMPYSAARATAPQREGERDCRTVVEMYVAAVAVAVAAAAAVIEVATEVGRQAEEGTSGLRLLSPYCGYRRRALVASVFSGRWRRMCDADFSRCDCGRRVPFFFDSIKTDGSQVARPGSKDDLSRVAPQPPTKGRRTRGTGQSRRSNRRAKKGRLQDSMEERVQCWK